MDKIEQYRNLIREILSEHAHPYRYSDEVETKIICDTESDNYQLSYIGWDGWQRIFNIIMHFEIKNGKIWVQHNGTETAVARVLTERGVPASDIVLGFHSAFKRQFGDYAVA